MVNHNHNKIAQSNFFIFGYAIFIFFKSIGQILRAPIYSGHTYNIVSYFTNIIDRTRIKYKSINELYNIGVKK